MNNNLKKEMNDWKVLEFDPKDLEETMMGVREIVKELPIRKHETSDYRQILSILRFHLPKVLVLQVVFCICLLAGLFLINSTSSFDQRNSIYWLITFSSIICAIATSFELLRVKIMGTWEIEKVCFVSLQKLLVIKMLILGSISILIIMILSMITSQFYEINFMVVFTYGYLPFLLITTIILRASLYVESTESILSIYALCIFVYGFIDMKKILMEIAPSLQLIGLSALTIYFVYTVKCYYTACGQMGDKMICQN